MAIATDRTAGLHRLRRDIIGIELDYTLLKTGLLLHKFNAEQPRVPAGDPEGGQWIGANQRIGDASAETAVIQPAFFAPTPPHPAVIAVEAAVALYVYLSGRNQPDQQAVIEFNAKQFEPDVAGGFDPRSVRSLTSAEVESICPRFADVQERTDRLTQDVDRRSPLLNGALRGTMVHSLLKSEIQSLDDPTYRAEISYLKSIEETYGTAGSVRVDVLEKTNEKTICVYDVKTGKRGLTIARTIEIAKEVHTAFGGVSSVIVTEVRPRR